MHAQADSRLYNFKLLEYLTHNNKMVACHVYIVEMLSSVNNFMLRSDGMAKLIIMP